MILTKKTKTVKKKVKRIPKKKKARKMLILPNIQSRRSR